MSKKNIVGSVWVVMFFEKSIEFGELTKLRTKEVGGEFNSKNLKRIVQYERKKMRFAAVLNDGWVAKGKRG